MRDVRERLLDIQEAIERIERYAAQGKGAFEQDELIQNWMVSHIQMMGEACRALPPERYSCAIPKYPGVRLWGCGISWCITTSR